LLLTLEWFASDQLFRHLAERRAFGNAQRWLSGPALPGSLSIVPGQLRWIDETGKAFPT
jgi:hypothetical protein